MAVLIDIFNSIKRYPFLYLMFFFTMLLSDDSFWFTSYGNSFLLTLKFVFLALLPLMLLLKGARFSNKNILFVFFLLVCVFISSAVNNSSLGGSIQFILAVTSALLVSNAVSLQLFARIYSNIVFIIIIFSLCIWTLILLGFIIPNNIDNIVGVTTDSYLGCVFFSGYVGSYRSSAFFREPGMFIVYICVSFILESFILKEKLTHKKILLYMLGILSTFSTAGFFIFGLLLFFYVKNNANVAKNIKTKTISYILFFIILIVVVSSDFIVANVFGKLSGESTSTFSRIASIFIPLNIMLDHFFLGVGTSGFRDAFIEKGLFLYNMKIDPIGQATNTLLNAGAIFGSWLFMLIATGFFKFGKLMFTNKFLQIFSFFLLCMIFSNESMVYSLIVYFLVFYALNTSGENRIVSF